MDRRLPGRITCFLLLRKEETSMKCLSKFKWIMLPRKKIPNGKGIMGAWMRLVSCAAYRKGKGRYRGHENDVTPGMWAGGVVGLKSILGVSRRAHAMFQLSRLEEQGYISYIKRGCCP